MIENLEGVFNHISFICQLEIERGLGYHDLGTGDFLGQGHGKEKTGEKEKQGYDETRFVHGYFLQRQGRGKRLDAALKKIRPPLTWTA